MSSCEKAVRAAALALKAAIDEAEAAGFRVVWPHRAAGLEDIAVSEGVAVAPKPSPEPKPKTFGGGRAASDPPAPKPE